MFVGFGGLQRPPTSDILPTTFTHPKASANRMISYIYRVWVCTQQEDSAWKQ